MKLDSVSSQSFGKIRYGQSVLKNVFSKNADKQSLLNLQKITCNLKHTKYDTMKSVDMIIEQAADKSFYAVLSRSSGSKLSVMALDRFIK